MNVVPFRREQPKFFWSYSRLKNYETCPKKYHEVDVQKNFKEPPSRKLEWGSEVHDALAERIAKKTKLPITMQRLEAEVVKIEDAHAEMGGELLSELELAIDNQFRASGWFDSGTWFRAKADVLLVAPPHAMAWDWKTGKIIEDIPQLALMAQTIFSNYPDVEFIGTRYVWLEDPPVYTDHLFERSEMASMWNDVWPRLQLLMNAHATNVFPARECWACARNCPVKTCQFNGRNR